MSTLISKVQQKIDKENTSFAADGLFALCAALFLLFLKLFSFAVMQSDDYYYASFFKGGLLNFFRLTADHFQSFNGRAFVHVFAQLTLSFPTIVFALLSSVILIFVCLLSCEFFRIFRLGKKDAFLFISLFYALLMLLPLGQIKEALMWVSASFNYLFPALIVLLAIVFYEKSRMLMYIFSLLAGFTTEQWGAAAFFMMSLCAADKFLSFYSSAPRTKKGQFRKNVFSAKKMIPIFLPPFLTLIGYMAIYLSPATRERLLESSEISPSVTDNFNRFASAFMENERAIVIPILFIASLFALSFIGKKYYPLLSGAVPFSLFFVSIFVKAQPVLSLSFFAFLAYLLFSSVVLFLSPLRKTGILAFGAFISSIIMLPSNTFDQRVMFPISLLLILSILSCVIVILNEQRFIREKKSVIYPFGAFLICLVSFLLFLPSFLGFSHNHNVEKQNLAAVKTAKETGVLHYNIDYDKRYAMKQMFNDGWFYNEFLSLYSLEDCEVVFESDIYDSIYCNGKKTNSVAYEGFIPVRDILSALGGELTYNTDTVVMKINGNTLTMQDGILTYIDKRGQTHYEIADDYRHTNFYTLALDESILEDSLGLKITKHNGRIDIE